MDWLGINGGGKYHMLEEDWIVQSLVWKYWSLDACRDPQGTAQQARAALHRWVGMGLPHRQEGGARYFDFCQVVNFMKAVGLAGRDPCYRDCALPTLRRLVSASFPAARGPGGGDRAPPGRFVVSFRREFNVEACAPGAPLRLRLPLPYDDPTHRDICVEVVNPGHPDARVTFAPGRLEVRLPAPVDRPLMAVEARITVTALQQVFAVDSSLLRPVTKADPDYNLYTRPREGMIRVSPAVARLAESLAGSAPDAWAAVIAFWAFFFDSLKSGYVHHDELDPTDPLGSLVERGWFDCYVGSALLVALCRARGIPARLVGGLLLYAGGRFPCDHYWAEVLLPPYGWVPLDLFSWELAGGRLDVEPWGRLFLGRLDYRMKLECLPRIFLGNPGVPFPAVWVLLTTLTGTGTEIGYYALKPHRLLFRDRVDVAVVPIEGGRPA